ncbi:MAG: ankyrin repeat domain-containing protein, partial [Proteobacteria bacterium]|nr:ankyrin repeat domain-containing protein [Pseudomonadota bacterium]
ACPKPGPPTAAVTKPSATALRRWLLSVSEALLAGRLSQARDFIGRALKVDPENAAAQRLLFEIVSDQRRLAELMGRIQALLDNRDLTGAERTVRRALSMDQDNQPAKAWLAKIEGLKRRVGAWLAQARAALEQGRLGAAYRLYTRVRELDVNNPQLRRGLSVLRAGLRPDDIFTAIKDNNLPLLSAVLYAHPGAITSRYRTGEARFYDFTPLHLAAWRGSPEAAKVLLNHGAGVEARVKRMHAYTPLHLAALMGRPAVTRLLVARGADLAVKDDQGRTPLDVAVDAGRQKLAALLTRLGGVATGTPKRIVRRLFAAAAAGDVESMKRLATGKALASIKSKSIDEIKRIGRTFKSVAGLKIDHGRATAQVIFDVSKVMTEQERRQLKRQLPALRKMARATTDPQARRNLEQKIADLEKGLVRVKVKLAKVQKRWLVADLEG